MATLRESLLVRFAVLNFAFTLLLVTETGASMYLNIGHELELLDAHGAAMMSGIMISPDDRHARGGRLDCPRG